jgi:hypothetical protein
MLGVMKNNEVSDDLTKSFCHEYLARANDSERQRGRNSNRAVQRGVQLEDHNFGVLSRSITPQSSSTHYSNSIVFILLYVN